MATDTQQPEQAPPEVLLRLQKRIRRLVWIAALTLGLGVAAVMAAIIYRFLIADTSGTATVTQALEQPIPQPENAPPAMTDISAASVGLAPDAELLSVELDGDRMALVFRDGADLVTVLVNATTMEVTGQLRMEGE